MKKGIIFDKDGTLLNFEAFWLPVTESVLTELARKFCVSKEAVQAAEERLGIDSGKADKSGVLCAGTYAEMSEIVRTVFSVYGTETAEREMYRELCRSFGENMNRGEIVPIAPGLKELLFGLKDGGYSLFVATTDNAGLTSVCLKKMGIHGLFDGVYTDGAGYPAKPDPYVIEQIVREHSIAKERLAMVGDTRTDLLFARRGGIAGIGYAADEQVKAFLAPFADALVCDLCELPDTLKELI